MTIQNPHTPPPQPLPTSPTQDSKALPQWVWTIIAALLAAGVGGGVGGGVGSGAALSAVDEDRIVAKAVEAVEIRRSADLKWLEAEFKALRASNSELKAEVKELRRDLQRRPQ